MGMRKSFSRFTSGSLVQVVHVLLLDCCGFDRLHHEIDITYPQFEPTEPALQTAFRGQGGYNYKGKKHFEPSTCLAKTLRYHASDVRRTLFATVWLVYDTSSCTILDNRPVCLPELGTLSYLVPVNRWKSLLAREIGAVASFRVGPYWYHLTGKLSSCLAFWHAKQYGHVGNWMGIWYL